MSTQNTSSERKAFKDWFDADAAKALGNQVHAVHPAFDLAAFVRLATCGLQELEFHARVQQFSDALAECLPVSKPTALKILVKSLPPILPGCDDMTDGWLQWPVAAFIANHGLPHFELSMKAMIEVTQRFTSEFAVRPFIEQDPERTLNRLYELTTHPNPHVRRWCSEGSRPRLPWGSHLRDLMADPTPLWPILEALKDDPELYVRRSVANHLNDIAKDHPEQVIAHCKAWTRDSNPDRDRLIKHALRSLIKAGNPNALAVIGYRAPLKLSATLMVRPRQITVGNSVELCATIDTSSARAQNLLVDYIVHYVRKGGKSSAKVFKWTTLSLRARSNRTLTKTHPMKVTTIRALYPGTHRIELQVNGAVCAETSFQLKA